MSDCHGYPLVLYIKANVVSVCLSVAPQFRGRAGQDRAGAGAGAGQDRAGAGAGQRRAGLGGAGQGRAGQGRAGRPVKSF